MGVPVIVYGKSGSGKSRSLKNFAEDEIYLINVLGKMMPFKGNFKYITTGDNVQTIMAGLAKMTTNAAVIDDFGYIMTNMFMRGHGSGDQFKLYNNIGDTVWNFINYVKNLDRNKVVYMIMHDDTGDDGFARLRTIGKLLDQKVCIEGMVTVVIRCMVKGDRHLFITNSDGNDLAKSPEEMFPEIEMENDLKAVDTAIREYWGLEPLRNIADTAKQKKEVAK